MRYFDYEGAAEKAFIAKEQVEAWRAGLEKEYPDDAMMVELRLLRACTAAQANPSARLDVTQSMQAEIAITADSHPTQ